MKKTLFASFALMAAVASADYPRIAENSVAWSQRGSTAILRYTLEGTRGIVMAKVYRDGVEIPTSLAALLEGDVNRLVETGSREITWRPRYPETVKNLKVELTVVPESLPPDYMVVDLASGDVRYYATTNDVPDGLTSDTYRKTKMAFRKIPAANRIWRKGDNVRISKNDDKYHNRNRPGLVTLTYDYWTAIYPLTHAQYRAVTGNWAPQRMTYITSKTDGKTRNRQGWPTEDDWSMCPADGVSITNMRGDPQNENYAWPTKGRAGVNPASFLGLLRTRTGGTMPFDMPTCAEWECACRGTSITTLGMTRFGEDTPTLADVEKYAWCTSNSQTDEFTDQYGAGRTHKVGQKLPNLWGLYDMLGNVNEVCLDYNPPNEGVDTADLPHQVNPVGIERTAAASSGSNACRRKVMGGVYSDAGNIYRPAYVNNDNVGELYSNTQWYGHRIVCPIAYAERTAVASDTPTLTFDATTREATIAYRLGGTDDKIVTIDVKTNGVSIGAQNFALLGGDVNKKVSPGDHYISWRPDHTWLGHHVDTSVDALTVEVKAWPTNNPPDYAVLHLGCASTPMYYDGAEAIPFGIDDDRYKLDNIVFRKIPAAGKTWRMGGDRIYINANEAPHLVQLTKDFWCSVFPLTQRQFYTLTKNDDKNNLDATQTGEQRFFMPAHQSFNTMRKESPWPQNGHTLGGDCWLQRLRTMYPDFQVDLPTEAQWEFAARAGTTTLFPNGSNGTGDTDKAAVSPYAWSTANNTDDPDYVDGHPHTIGLKKPNAWGLYEMGGNAQNICLDRAQSNIQPTDGSVSIDPVGPTTGTYHVGRGGAFSDGWMNFRSQYRNVAEQIKDTTGDRWRSLRLVAPVAPEPLD